MPEDAYIAIGSNVEPERHIPRAVQALARLGTVVAISTPYQNAAVGSPSQPDFINAVARVRTSVSPAELRAVLRAIEAELGRVRTDDKYAPRTIDLDLCLYGAEIMETDDVTLPHPDILTRPHVAVPLAELAPDAVHPVTGEALSQIAARLRPQVRFTPRPDAGPALPLAGNP